MKKFLRENLAVVIRILVSVCLIALGLILNGVNEQISIILYLVSYIVIAYEIIYKAIKKLILEKEIGEKMLMTIASLGAIVTDSYFEAALVVSLYLLGELIEDGATTHAKRSIEMLCEIRPARARIKETGELVPVEEIEPGTIIEVFAGERIPLDGKVIDGVADLETSVVTGESAPQNIRQGAEVYAGYLDLNGALSIEVVRKSEESMVQRIIDASMHASERKSKSESFTKKFAKIYTPSVIVLALLVAIVPSLFGLDMIGWAYKAFSLLAIACPCALVISVPLAYFTGVGYASRRGVLIKGSKVIESLASLNTMAFDKTGTLTKSEPRVTKVESISSYTKMQIIELVSIAEYKSSHPLAIAVLREAERFKIKVTPGENYREEVGFGVECDSMYGKIRAGSYKYAGGCKPDSQASIYVSLDGKCIGYIGIGDNIKLNGKISFDKLREQGVKKIYVLSGDKKEKVDIVASTLYADGAYSQLLPGQKLDALEDIISGGDKVKIGYCGDGINDLPCISRADVGFAIGTVSTDAAVEHSDVAIVDDDLEKIPMAIRIAKNTRTRVIANIAFAIGTKALLAILSIVLPTFPMIFAVLADVGVMLITIINSLLAGRGKN